MEEKAAALWDSRPMSALVGKMVATPGTPDVLLMDLVGSSGGPDHR